MDAVWLPSTLAAGSTQIDGALTGRDFEAGGRALIWASPTSWEVVDITSVDTDHLHCGAVAGTWGLGTRVVPLRPAYLQLPLSMQRAHGALAHAPLQFLVDPGEGQAPGRLASSGLGTYQSLPILTTPPNSREDLSETVERSREWIDAGPGPVALVDLTGFNEISRPYLWTLTSRAEIAAFLGFLDQVRGMAVPFWMPSWCNDLEQTATIGAAATVLQVRDTGYHLYVSQAPNRRDLAFWPADGSAPILRRITASAAGPTGHELLTLDSAFGAEKSVGAFEAISFVSLYRLAADTVTLTWHTDELVEVQLLMVEVAQ
jgi:hypothetical protein